MKLKTAQALGRELVKLLAPGCDETPVIAGSTRREKPEPGDIEIVVRPTIIYRDETDLFGNVIATTHWNKLDELCADLLGRGILAKRFNKNHIPVWGPGVKLGLYRGEKIDIFACIPPAQFGNTLAIRTGPGDFNKLLVTSRRFGGACPANRRVVGARVWDIGAVSEYTTYDFVTMKPPLFLKIAEEHSIPIIPTLTEEAFFAALGVPCWPPPERTLERLKAFLRQENGEGV